MSASGRGLWTRAVVVAACFATHLSFAEDRFRGEPQLQVEYAPIVLPTNRAIVTDDLSTMEDLSHKEDFDMRDERMLVVRWEFPESDYTDFHVYVKGPKKGFQFLGRTKTGEATYLVWEEGAEGIREEFAAGPQFGESYQFKVYGITTSGMPVFRGPFLTAGPVRFNEQTAEVELPPGTAIVTDDLSTTEDLSGGEDQDTPDERALVVRWQFEESNYRDFHVYIKQAPSEDYVYLGRTKSGTASYLSWAEDEDNIKGKFRDGPQFGESYQFRVYGITVSGRPKFRGPLETAGPVAFVQAEPSPTPEPTPPEAEPTATPTPEGFVPVELGRGKVIVTDDLSTTEDLSRGEDLDTEDERMLVVRWNFVESNYKDFHVYVKASHGGFTFLGRTKTGEASHLVWAKETSSKIREEFEDGPQFGESYQFKVYGITISGRPKFRGPLVTAGPVKFSQDFVVLPTVTATPVIPSVAPGPPRWAIVTDDLSSTEDLSRSVDFDTEEERMLVIRWRFTETDYKHFHVYVKEKKGKFQYLGRTDDGETSLLAWAKQEEPGFINSEFRDGPEFGESYQFKVYGIPAGDKPKFRGPLVTAGPVRFLETAEPEPVENIPTPVPSPSEQATPTPTVTPKPPDDDEPPAGEVTVTDDLLSMEDLSGLEDFDLETERMLVIRWSFGDCECTDFQVFVKESRGGYELLGETGTGDASYLIWAEGEPGLEDRFEDGPEFGQTYQFKVIGETASGRPPYAGPIVPIGPVRFGEEPPPTRTPTPGVGPEGSDNTNEHPETDETPTATPKPNKEKPEKPEKPDNPGHGHE